MNNPSEIAHKVIENLRDSPVMLGLLVLNLIMLFGFWWTLSSVSSGMERRDSMIKSCIEKVT